MARTELLFLSDTFQCELSTLVSAFDEDENGAYIETNETIFYPGGGGQEPDKGSVADVPGRVVPVVHVLLINHHVRLYYEKDQVPFKPGDPVTICIDKDHRLKNARLHTGGHLLSSVIYEKLKLPLIPVKGFHYQQGAYIEFEPSEDIPEIGENNLNEVLKEDIQRQLPVTTKIVHENSLLFKQAFKPAGFVVPEDSLLRLVKIGDYLAYPCGGTHLHHTGELNYLRIKHIKHKKGRVRVSYDAG